MAIFTTTVSGSSYTSSLASGVGYFGTASFAVSSSYAAFALTPAGTSGTSGTTGTSGTSGANGTSGNSGSSGTSGSSGSSGTSASVTINANTNNYVVTATGTTNTLQGEANLTFDGTTLNVTGISKATSYFSANDQGYIRGDQGAGNLTIQGGSTSTTFNNSSNAATLMTILNGGNVGIGTTNPTAKLHVSTTSADTVFRLGNNGATDQYIYFNGAADWAMGIDTSNGNAFKLSRYSSLGTNDIITVTTGSNIGIGTTNPEYALDVNSSDIRFGTTETGNVSFRIGTNSTHRYLQLLNSGAASGLKVGGLLVSDTYSYADPGRNDLIVKGNVGIGTTSPSVKLDVYQGAMRITGLSGGGWLELSGNLPGYSANTYQVLRSNGTIHFANNDKYCAFLEGSNTYFGILDSSLDTKVFLHTSGNSYLNGGNVGIGTTSPGTKLDVNGTTTFRDTVFMSTQGLLTYSSDLGNGEGGTVLGSVASKGVLLRGGASGTGVFVNSSNNVGIGTTSPNALLVAKASGNYGTIACDNSTTTGGGAFAVRKQGSAIGYLLNKGSWFGDTTNDLCVAAETGYNVRIYTNGSTTEKFIVTTGGNVGIGTTSPAFNTNGGTFLSVHNSSFSAWLDLGTSSTTDGHGGAVAFNNLNRSGTDKRIAQIAGVRAGGNDTGDIIFSTWNAGAGADRMKLTAAGNVGIGTSSPQAALDVRGGILRSNSRVSDSQNYPVGHYTPGDVVFEIDPTWTQAELQEFFGSTSVTWTADSTSPGGYAIQIAGYIPVGGVYNSGFPYIPVDQDDTFYMECWIRNTTGTNNQHYMGSIDYNESFSSLGGNPGSFGYWVMLNANPGTSWTKVSGYIKGFGSSTGQFASGTKYWTPQALFNYSNSGTCIISGWKVTKVSQPGEKIFKASVGIGTTTRPSYALDVTGTIRATADVIAYSDRRAKENIITISNALQKVVDMRGVYYNMIDDQDKTRKVGVIAQEILEIAPELVSYVADKDQYSVAYGNITALLIEAIKELKMDNDHLRSRITDLEER
jgi:hypothetical protein